MSTEAETITDILTPRQIECMRHVEQGLTAKQIAHKLNISHRTVEQHVAVALEALGANNRLAAVARMRELEPKRAEEPAYTFMLREASAVNPYLLPDPLPRFAEAPEIEGEWPFVPRIGGGMNKAPFAIRNAWIIRIAVIAIMLTVIPILTILGLSEIAVRAQ